MLGQRQDISCIGADKGRQGHFALCRKTNGLVVHLLNALDALRARFHKARVVYAFKYIKHHRRIVDHGACKAQRRVNNVIRSDGGAVRPDSRIVDMDDEILIVLCCDGICQLRFKV